MTKQDLLAKVQSLPEDTPFEKIADEIEKIRFKAHVDRGIRQAEAGQTVPHEEVEAMMDEWFGL